MVDKDAENYQLIMHDFVKVIEMFKQQRKDEAEKLDILLKAMETIFTFIDSLDYSNATQMFTQQFTPAIIAMSVEIISDASEVERFVLRRYRELLINRLNSYTKNRKLINDLALAYCMQFMNCFEQHSNGNLRIQRLIYLYGLGMQNSASASFTDFLEGPVANLLEEKKKEYQKKFKDNGGKDWKNSAVK